MDMNEQFKEQLGEIVGEGEQQSENNPLDRKPKDGDTVVFLIKKDDIVRLGKVASKFDCVIDQYGNIFYTADVTDMWYMPINKVQETIHYNESFTKTYENLVAMSSEDVKTKQIEDYINDRVVRVKGTLSDDKQFLVELFTRNVRNDKIDFDNYKFMMELLFESPDNEFNSKIDLRELRTICYNMFSIMNRISQETYDDIYQKLAEFASPNDVAID